MWRRIAIAVLLLSGMAWCQGGTGGGQSGTGGGSSLCTLSGGQTTGYVLTATNGSSGCSWQAPLANGATVPSGQTLTIASGGTLTCAAGSTCPSGAGTVTVVGAGNLTSTNIATGGGLQTIQTPSSGATVDSSGNLVATTVTSTGAATIGGTNGQLKITEGSAPSPGSGFDWLWADSTAHALKVNNNNGTSAQVILSSSDINTSNQVVGQHFTAFDIHALTAATAFLPPSASGAVPTTKGVFAYDSGTVDGPVFGDGTNTQDVAFIHGADSTGHCAQFAGDGTARLVAASGTCGSGSGTVTGSGASPKVPLWSSSTALTNSAISDNGTTVSSSEPVTMGASGAVNGYAGLTTPGGAPTLADVGTGGTLAFNTRYDYSCLATNGVGWTAASAQNHLTTANDSNNTHSVTITCPTVSGATGYVLLGRGQFYPQLGVNGATTSFTDTGAAVFGSGVFQGNLDNTTVGIGFGGSSATTYSPTANDVIISREGPQLLRFSSPVQDANNLAPEIRLGGGANAGGTAGTAFIAGTLAGNVLVAGAPTIDLMGGANTIGSSSTTLNIYGSLNMSTSGGGTGQVSAVNFVSGGTKFTSNNGCSETTLVGGATAGSFASGTTGTCTLTITFGNSSTAAHAWACFSNDLTTPADLIHQTASTTTTVTLSGTTISGDVVNFACIGY